LTLSELLQGTSFVEFLTIHVFDPEASSFSGTVVDKTGSIIRVAEDDRINVARAVKRRKLDKTVGLKTVFSVVGGYGSEDSSPAKEETANKNLTGLATLDAYSGSDDEVINQNAEVEEDQSLNSDDDIPGEDNHIDLNPAKLLELVKQAQSAVDEDMLDWGDEWDIDGEEQMSNAEPC